MWCGQRVWKRRTNVEINATLSRPHAIVRTPPVSVLSSDVRRKAFQWGGGGGFGTYASQLSGCWLWKPHKFKKTENSLGGVWSPITPPPPRPCVRPWCWDSVAINIYDEYILGISISYKFIDRKRLYTISKKFERGPWNRCAYKNIDRPSTQTGRSPWSNKCVRDIFRFSPNNSTLKKPEAKRTLIITSIYSFTRTTRLDAAAFWTVRDRPNTRRGLEPNRKELVPEFLK